MFNSKEADILVAFISLVSLVIGINLGKIIKPQTEAINQEPQNITHHYKLPVKVAEVKFNNLEVKLPYELYLTKKIRDDKTQVYTVRSKNKISTFIFAPVGKIDTNYIFDGEELEVDPNETYSTFALEDR
jgi:hypothetical protein